ncbi:hypothetical protein [Halorussus halobius]|uniref:hypothetical protein n=1 Tax=Halorussus halobius TaxID=1710537 RepID=UPI001091B79E|nr:hypothetical protein [Halorussus halobius]
MPADTLYEALVRAADHSSPCQRVLRHKDGRQVATRSMDFYVALKRVDVLVVRIDGGHRVGGSLFPVDCRVREGAVEFTHEHRNTGVAGRQQFLGDIREANEVALVHVDESQFGDERERDTGEVRADGGTSTDGTYRECEWCGEKTPHRQVAPSDVPGKTVECLACPERVEVEAALADKSSTDTDRSGGAGDA